MTDTQSNVHTLDAAYKPFPTFEQWTSRTKMDTVRWDRYNAALKQRGEPSPAALQRARQIATRAAAIDTGAIEGLYESDRGFTYTVAFETTAWEMQLAARGDQVRPLFEAQLHGYEFVLTLATGAEPISEAAIRELHLQMCKAQDTYRVATAIGFQEQPLPKGRYKALANHVRTRDGQNHSYAPVDITPNEMARLISECRSETFMAAHPVIQAAYAHYALVVVHPFADGNGRVARALASAFTYRAISMPIVILSERKDAYLDALEDADLGNYQSFVDFMLARSLDTTQLVDESLRGASAVSIDHQEVSFRNLYLTKGGMTQDEVDAAGELFFQVVLEELKRTIERVSTDKVSGLAMERSGSIYGLRSNYRSPSGGGRILMVRVDTAAPADAAISQEFGLMLPCDASGDEDLLIAASEGQDEFAARIDETVPQVSSILRIRAAMFAERIVSDLLSKLLLLAKEALSH
jgi:Fic family protein